MDNIVLEKRLNAAVVAIVAIVIGPIVWINTPTDLIRFIGEVITIAVLSTWLYTLNSTSGK